MKKWLSDNYKTLIVLTFLVPIIIVAIVSISHVTQWYGISNPLSWAIYLSVGIEVAALSSLAALTANMGRKVYFPFIIVTFIQFIGNVFFAYEFIEVTSALFTSWVELVSPLFEFVGVRATDIIAHKRILAFLAGGMLPIISLSFLHMLIKFTESNKSESKFVPEVKEENPDELKIKTDEETIRKAEEILLSKSPKTRDEILKKIREEAKSPREKFEETMEEVYDEINKEWDEEELEKLPEETNENYNIDEYKEFLNELDKEKDMAKQNPTNEETGSNSKLENKQNQMENELKETFPATSGNEKKN